jgi:hypothetical protein
MFKFPSGMNNKISTMKAISKANGMGLKESKHLAEAAELTSQVVDVPDEQRCEFIKVINAAGGVCTSDEQFAKYRDDLKQIAVAATLADDTIIAEEILAFVNDRFRYVKGVHYGQ